MIRHASPIPTNTTIQRNAVTRRDADAAQPQASAERVHCGKCGKTFSGGQIVNQGAEFSARAQAFICARSCYCDHCDHVFSWLSACTEAGVPYGLPLNLQGFLKARSTVAAWKRKHAHTLDPEAA